MPTVTLKFARSFDGQVLSDDEGWNATKGECATGVQYVFYKAGKPLGKTSGWRQGELVKGSGIAPGTAIASFKDKKFKGTQHCHAAILIKETTDGLSVWDQWSGQPWHTRTLRFNDKDTKDYSNNGNLFYVI